MKSIHLPSLRGNFGDWSYYSTIIKIKDIVDGNRIITIPESKALYSKNINQILQREIDFTRIGKIKEYILKNNERFFSSLIVAIHKGNPEWADFDLERQFRIDNERINDLDVEFIENKIGILTLNGNEEIFVLDGQHRLLGIRKAVEEDQRIGEDEISLIIVIHNSDLIQRTRRLFTVLNRYAVSIKPAEKVILEEDDAAAILTRKLVQEYSTFVKDNAVSSTKLFNLTATDTKNFTSLVCLYEISKILIDYSTLYKSKVIIRPSEEALNKLYFNVTSFWDFFFEKFPEVIKFINEEKVSSKFERNKKTGGSLLLRPEGQLLFASIYKEFEKLKKLEKFKELVVKIDFSLDGINWNYIFWRGDKMVTKYKRLKRAIFKYLLGEEKDKTYIINEMTKIYKEHNLIYKNKIIPVTK
ncbi:MAG: DGQHR domain-containing protein [Bacteroidales bacterium]|nr:DGQHR domain-containing protein [Bacteroidales bacterium]